VKVQTAQLAGGPVNADRVFCTHHAVIVLDGATAFEPVDVDPATYADTLGRTTADQLDHRPDAALSDVVATAITATADRLDLRPGWSPSSTIAILRTREGVADLYVLGDSPIHYGTGHATTVFTDARLAAVAPDERAHCVTRLRAGHGFDDEHRAALIALQRAQRTARNTPDGYWIAEADPDAAHHAVQRTVPGDHIGWAVLATDGAADYIDHTSQSWARIALYDSEQLDALLGSVDRWESETDPDGQALPRAKRHDDKTIAAISTLW
jgi:hypothetical protein